MATYIVTTSNWNSPAFWSGISESTDGHSFDFSALPSNFTVNIDAATGVVSISDGTTTFTVGEPGDGSTDANLGGSTVFEFFSLFTGGSGDDTIDPGRGSETVNAGAGDDTIVSGVDPANTALMQGTSDSFTGTNGNSDFTGTVTSDVGGVSYNSFFSAYGFDSTDEVHTHAFSQEVYGATILVGSGFSLLEDDDFFTLYIDGVAVDLNTAIADGDVIVNSFLGTINPDGTLSGNAFFGTSATIEVLVPFNDIGIGSSGSGDGFSYSFLVVTDPYVPRDEADLLRGEDDADTFIIKDRSGDDTIVGGEGGTDDDTVDLSNLSSGVEVDYTGNEEGTIDTCRVAL